MLHRSRTTTPAPAARAEQAAQTIPAFVFGAPSGNRDLIKRRRARRFAGLAPDFKPAWF